MFFRRNRTAPVPQYDGEGASSAAAWKQRIAELEAEVGRLRKVEIELVQTEQRYRSLLDHNLDAVFSLDRNGCLTSVNPAAVRMTGYTTEELVGMSIARLVAPEELVHAYDMFNRTLFGDRNEMETIVMTKDGRRLNVFVAGAPIIVGSEAIGVFGFCRDITEQKRLEAQLQHVNG
jgi:PAS domain S-box-containing protein